MSDRQGHERSKKGQVLKRTHYKYIVQIQEYRVDRTFQKVWQTADESYR